MVQEIQNGDHDVFGERDFVVTDDDILEFRKRLQEEVKNDPDAYHPADLQKMWDSAELCRRFIRQKFLRVEEAVQMAKMALMWRNKFEVNDITESNVPLEWFAFGAMFPLGKDKYGSQMIISRVKLHRKNERMSKQMKRFLVFWVEKLLYELDCVRLSFVFDCAGSGYANLDMEQIGFLINLFKSYYPWALGFILVYDMPWLYNTAWKVIKSWLPAEGVERIKFVDKNTILNYVDRDNLPSYMGGTQKLPFLEYSHEDVDFLLQNAYNRQIIDERIPHTKAVQEFYRSRFKMFSQRHTGVASFVKIQPEVDLVFGGDDLGGNVATLTITNTSKSHVTFKIKTNNIDAYKVKPFFGIVPTNDSVQVNVALNPGSELHPTDKLLIMTTGIDTLEFSPRELIDHWKKVSKEAIKEHRLRCRYHNGVQEVQLDSTGERSMLKSAAQQALGDSKELIRLGNTSQDTTGELQTQLNGVCTQVTVLSKRVDQIWRLTIFSMGIVLANLFLLYVLKSCQSSSSWYC
ncbi:motile sperm domain-containing protein 2-like [Ornithodoros turicata]|uniref:motile sperm domain-containing protein 2-like n=1 Tax=Ornithodoros turicata TaxID=34597 RepID=UPI003138A599